MDKDFILDENGWISDDDPIYENLDKWHENNEYDNILETIYAISREMWSNKLWFRLVSALNNKHEFDKAKEELNKLSERCKTPQDKGSFYYMLGYIYFMEDKEITALRYYNKATDADPKKDLKEECAECQKCIDEALNKQEVAIDDIIKLIDGCLKVVPKKEKVKPNENEFALIIGLIPSVHTLPCVEEPIGIESIFAKYDKSVKEDVRQWLWNVYNIKDIKTLKAVSDEQFNVKGKYNDIAAYLAGKRGLPIELLNDERKSIWDACMVFCKKFVEKVPNLDLSAWDISEKTGLVRHAYGCDIISDSEYILAVMELTDEIKKRYSSWNDYLAGYIFGSGLFMFLVSDFNIDKAVNFMCKVAEAILQSDIPNYKWADGLRRTIKFED